MGVATCAVSSVIYQIYHSISTYLGPKYLHLPQNENQVRQKVGEFETKYGMPQCFECVDGTHTQYLPHQKSLKTTFVINNFISWLFKLYVILEPFMDIECRWSGSVHDSKVFANFSISMKMRNGAFSQTFQTLVPGLKKILNYLIGHPA